MLKLFEGDIKDLTCGLQDTVIMIASTSQSATLRAKSLKILGHLVKAEPESIFDQKIK